jgi:hypothetical protein
MNLLEIDDFQSGLIGRKFGECPIKIQGVGFLRYIKIEAKTNFATLSLP